MRKTSSLLYYIPSMTIGVLGFALASWPSNERVIPPSSPFALATLAPISFTEAPLAARFDFDALVKKPPPKLEPEIVPDAQVDPAADLKKFTFLGGAAEGQKSTAIFSDGQETRLLQPGDNLADHPLLSFDEKSALFAGATGDVALAINHPESQ